MSRPSLRGSINAFCRWCIYDPKSGIGTWRQQVEACTSPDCPLYAVRPLSEAVEDEAETVPFGAQDASSPVGQA